MVAGGKILNILIPDAVYDDDHAQERAAVAPDALVLRRATAAWDVADEDWQEADAVVAYYRLAYDAAVSAKLARCRILVRAGVGYDNVDRAAFAAHGIPVCNVPDYGTSEVADHAVALLLALTRGIVEFHRGLVADPIGAWDWRRWPPPVRRLKGQRLLLVGFGAIARTVARRAVAFDLSLGIYDPFLPAGAEQEFGATRYESLEAGLAEADIVSLHVPLTLETHNLIDRRRIAAMKPGGILINTARGKLVDLDALAEGLRDGRIGAAGLDVLPAEPPDPDHALFRALREDAPWLRGRFVVTPHSAFLSADAIRDMRLGAVETALAYLRHGELRHCVSEAELEAAGVKRR